MKSGDDDRDPVNPRSGGRRLLRNLAITVVVTFAVGYLLAAVWMLLGSPRNTVASVPGLRGLSLTEAGRVVGEADLVLELTDSLPNPELARGQVLTQSPLPGQEVAPGSTVQVIVSTGRERRTVPQVNALSRDQAEQLLRATGMEPVVQEVENPRRAGGIIGTDPAAGTVVEIPVAVQLLISSGPPRVAVPDLVGSRMSDVTGMLAAAGLRLGESTYELRISEAEGQVVSQRPTSRDSVTAGSLVNVVVATQRIELLPPLEIR